MTDNEKLRLEELRNKLELTPSEAKELLKLDKKYSNDLKKQGLAK